MAQKTLQDTPRRSRPYNMTDFNDRMGVPRNDYENQAVTGKPVPGKRRRGSLRIQVHPAARRDGRDKHFPGWRGHIREHERNSDPHSVHCSPHRYDGATAVVLRLSQNWAKAAVVSSTQRHDHSPV